MPKYEIEAPDGRVLEIEGDTPPTDADLDEIFKSVATEAESKQGIDLTPSGVIKGLTKNVSAGITAPINAIMNDTSLKEGFEVGKERIEEARKKDPLHNAQNFLMDTALYSTIPLLRGGGVGKFVGNAMLQGGIPGALEGLKQGKAGQGFGIGTGVGAGIQSLPYVGKIAKPLANMIPATGGLLARTIGRVSPETLQRAVQADSKALDLTAKDAENLLMNTTERVRNQYNDILAKRGQDVGDAINRLEEIETPIKASDIKQDITSTFDQYQRDAVNPAREIAGDLEGDLLNTVNKMGAEEISPMSLQGLKELVGKKAKWGDEVAQGYAEPITEQIYGKYADRLSQLSPEIQAANKAFADVAKFKKNEGLQQILKAGDRIDSASSKLKNYNNTVTKGNTGRNVQDLEDLIVSEGGAPFLKDIDDVNAAMDLLNIRTTGDSWLANLATQATRPALRAYRGLNRLAPKLQGLKGLTNNVGRLVTPATIQMLPLEGGVVYNEDRY